MNKVKRLILGDTMDVTHFVVSTNDVILNRTFMWSLYKIRTMK